MDELSALEVAEAINRETAMNRDDVDYQRARANHQYDIDLAKVYELRFAKLTALLPRCTQQEREAIGKMLGIICNA